MSRRVRARRGVSRVTRCANYPGHSVVEIPERWNWLSSSHELIDVFSHRMDDIFGGQSCFKVRTPLTLKISRII